MLVEQLVEYGFTLYVIDAEQNKCLNVIKWYSL